jgi:hypothetical protein
MEKVFKRRTEAIRGNAVDRIVWSNAISNNDSNLRRQ